MLFATGALSALSPAPLYPAEISPDHWGFIDAQGKVVIPPRFHFAQRFSEGLALAEPLDRPRVYGYIDHQGNWAIPAQFPMHDPVYTEFSGGFAIADIKGIPNFIDKAGQPILPHGVSAEKSFSDGLGLVADSTSHRYGYVDASGRLAITPQFLKADSFHEGLAAVGEARDYQFIDKRGKPAFPDHFQGCYYFSEGLAPVQPKGTYLWGFVDTRGHMVIDPRFLICYPFQQGLAEVAVAVNNRRMYGYVNHQGTLVIDGQFAEAGGFTEGLADVDTTGGWGYIDRSGRTVIQGRYRVAEQFIDGLARVETGVRPKHWGYIDRTGRYVWGPVEAGDYFPYP